MDDCISLTHSRVSVADGKIPKMRSSLSKSLRHASWAKHEQPRSAPATLPWRTTVALDEWVKKEARPISLRQLAFFARTLTEDRLLSSANYLRTELPTRLAHRLRDMQTLPFVVVSNPHISHVYELYFKAFEAFRKVKEIRHVQDNDDFCAVIGRTLKEHLSVIPRLAMGVLECRELMPAEDMDKFMNIILRSRISRRVIAEQHVALTEAFGAQRNLGSTETSLEANSDVSGQVLLKCHARQVLEYCGVITKHVAKQAYALEYQIPEIKVIGDLEAMFPYVIGHLEYIIGELLRNSMQAVVERYRDRRGTPPPIEVLVCETPQHVIFRISDRGGGIPRNVLPDIWSFSKGPRYQSRLRNLSHVPKMAATIQELEASVTGQGEAGNGFPTEPNNAHRTSLGSLTSRPPNLRLGVGLPMSRVYAEYWAGSLEIQSMEGYGTDSFLQIPKLGNKNEQLTTRASMDAI